MVQTLFSLGDIVFQVDNTAIQTAKHGQVQFKQTKDEDTNLRSRPSHWTLIVLYHSCLF